MHMPMTPPKRALDRKAQIADFEIAFFEMLELALRIELGVAGQMDLAVFADDIAGLVDQNRGVVVVGLRRLPRSVSA